MVVDEAYIDFGGRSALELVSRYDNLLVVQTFSKSSFHGGDADWICDRTAEIIKALNDFKYSLILTR